MFRRRSNVDVEPLERRALLSHVGVAGVMGIRQQAKGRGPALVGSIQGEEVFQANFTHEQFQGTGTVQPMGSVTVSGSFQPNQKTAAVNGRGTLSFWTSQGSVSLSMITRGFFTSPSLKQTNSEELRDRAGTIRDQQLRGHPSQGHDQSRQHHHLVPSGCAGSTALQRRDQLEADQVVTAICAARPEPWSCLPVSELASGARANPGAANGGDLVDAIRGKFVIRVKMVRFSAILLHTLPVPAQCGYNVIYSRAHRKLLQNP